MLRKIQFKNYRCFENSEIQFRKTAIVVGQNNAGKSTIVEALRILSAVAQKFKAEMSKHWNTLEDKLSVCNGKDLISLINGWILRQYKKHFSSAKLFASLTADDICKEMKEVISLLTKK